MRAEIIAVGTELTTGAKLNTNSQWLSGELAQIGLPVVYHTTVADDLEANLAVLQTAVERADVVVITGGLGPTLDDLTRDVLARLAGVELELDRAQLAIIQAMFSNRQRIMPERNVVQAMFPRGSEPIPNPIGTAPGIYLELPRPGRDSCRIAALPGVPSEMKRMYADWLQPRFARIAPAGVVIRQARINCFGIGESACEELLGDVTRRGRDPEVGITVHEATITLRIVAVGGSVPECDAKIAATRQTIFERLADYVFGEEDDELQHVVVRRLAAAGKRVALCEGWTGGQIAAWLTDVDRERKVFCGGWVLGSGVPDAASDALGMAQRCRAHFGADYGLAITEARMNGSGAPLAELALVGGAEIHTQTINLAGDSTVARSRAGKALLNLLRLDLLPRASH